MLWKAIRWILAGGSLLASVWLIVTALLVSGILMGFPLIGGLLFLVLFVVLIAPDTIGGWCAKPFTELFYPTEEFEKPPLSYVLARRYSRERKVEAAVDEYEKILFYYPRERDAYLELMELARRVGDEEMRVKYEGMMRERERLGVEAPEPAHEDAKDNECA